MARKRTLTYQQAVEDILVFVEEGEEDENFGEDLYGKMKTFNCNRMELMKTQTKAIDLHQKSK